MFSVYCTEQFGQLLLLKISLAKLRLIWLITPHQSSDQDQSDSPEAAEPKSAGDDRS